MRRGVSPGVPVAVGWPTELKRDPRRRAAAGLGAWCAIDQQDQLADGARRQAGAFDVAAHAIRFLDLGLAAGRSLFANRLPPSTDGVGRLVVLGPLLRRLPSTQGGTAERALVGRTPMLHPALLSGAVRRILRPGTAVAAGAGVLTAGDLLRAANRCPDPPRPTMFSEMFRTLRGEPDPRAVSEVLARWEREFGRLPIGDTSELSRDLRRLAEERRPRPCNEVDLARLGNALAEAIDPGKPSPPARRRVLGRFKGFGDPHPTPVLEPELDLPLAPVIKKLAPQWLLPGRGLVPDHTIVELAANPRFIEAALIGANHRALAELRWRNIRVRSGWSPLRRFWPRPENVDLAPIRAWPAGSPLGAPSHRPAGPPPDLLIVIIRSPILRRYPGTAIYLLKPSVDVDRLAENLPPPPTEADRVLPLFKGAIEPDLHYIGFPLTPIAAASHHLVLEEPPAEPRFRMESPHAPGTAEHAAWIAARATAKNGAAYTTATFHQRTVAVIKLLDVP